jgi:long-chain acyl-CoA synthetase
VESALYDHPAVAEACVVGVPDPSQGERVVAVVVPKDPTVVDETLERELIDHCRARLIKWCCPREVDFAVELPRTKVGKIDFTTISREAAERRQAAV